MSELFDKLSGGQVLGLIAILTGAVYLISDALAGQWVRMRRNEAETNLKRELLAAGKSTEEIERIVRATTQNSKDCS